MTITERILKNMGVLVLVVTMTTSCSSDSDNFIEDVEQDEVIQEEATQEEIIQEEVTEDEEIIIEEETSEKESTEVEVFLNISDYIKSDDNLSLFADGIAKAGLEDRFDDGLFTVFAPTNEAIEDMFETLGDDYNSFDDFTNILEQQALVEIILGHVVAQVIVRSDLNEGALPTLIEDDTITVIQGAGGLALQDASQDQVNFVEFDIEASNGIIHTIDKILIPQKALLLIN